MGNENTANSVDPNANNPCYTNGVVVMKNDEEFEMTKATRDAVDILGDEIEGIAEELKTACTHALDELKMAVSNFVDTTFPFANPETQLAIKNRIGAQLVNSFNKAFEGLPILFVENYSESVVDIHGLEHEVEECADGFNEIDELAGKFKEIRSAYAGAFLKMVKIGRNEMALFSNEEEADA